MIYSASFSLRRELLLQAGKTHRSLWIGASSHFLHHLGGSNSSALTGSHGHAAREPQQQQPRRSTFPCAPAGSSASFSTAMNTTYFGKKAYGAFHFGTIEYASCFEQLPQPGVDGFRAEGVKYLEERFDPKTWYDDPIATHLNGAALPHETTPVDTHSALGVVNGQQVMASAAQVQTIKDHILSLKGNSEGSPKDLRDHIRQVEQELLTNHAGELVGHQCVDFCKQDGATELEEMVMACVVERRLNDYLLLEEKRGYIRINRSPIYVPCVSNFTHFLDLSRKVLRSLEVGIPVIVMGRTSTTQQHPYRWFQLLQKLCQQQPPPQGRDALDPSYLTYMSCTLADTQDILQSCAHHTGNLYLTGSRALAADIKSIYPNTIASTGGPNTMVICTPKHANPVHQELTVDLDKNTTRPNPQLEPGENKKEEEEQEEEWFTQELRDAIRISAAIESSGQCTALRHVIVPPDFTGEDIDSILSGGVTIATDPQACLKAQQFDGVFLHQATSGPSTSSAEYKHDEETETYWRLNESLPSATTPMPEYWRKVVVDYSKLETDPWEYSSIDKLAHWLNVTQPISLAVNGNMVDSYKTMRRLFDRTSLAVYTAGGRNNETIETSPHPKMFPPALTCQARPQECEIFGEVPPRHSRSKYTKYPMYIPSSNPSYDASYEPEYLTNQKVGSAWNKSTSALLEAVSSPEIKGYCCLLVEYLRNVDDQNPKEVAITSKARTVLWGIQRPPIQTKTVLRCGAATTWDACAPAAILFQATNAREQLQFSISPDNAALKSFCEKHKLEYVVETDAELEQRVEKDFAAEEKGELFQVSYVDNDETGLMKGVFPMVGQFASLYFPMGHVKSTAASDHEFLMRLNISQKWLKALF